MTIDQLEKEALGLPQHERARLAQRLISSLDEDAEVEQAWYDEAERRLAELESGGAAEISVEEVFGSLDGSVKR